MEKKWNERKLGDLTRTPTSGKERWRESEKEDDRRAENQGADEKALERPILCLMRWGVASGVGPEKDLPEGWPEASTARSKSTEQGS